MREIEFEVLGRPLTALTSGSEGQPRLLALHGWLDNAASFEPLSRALPEVQLVALDMAGHGKSAHRSADGEYNIWSDLPDIQGVVDQLGWDTFNLLGHSRGAIVSCLFASALPERVENLVLLDGLVAQGTEAGDCTQQFAAFLHDKARLLDRQGRVFATIEEGVAVRERNGLQAEAARLIGERNLRKVDGGWCWSTDARLQGASAMKLTPEHNQAIVDGLSMPVLVLLAEQGLRERFKGSLSLPDKLLIESVPGGHHCHMDDAVEEIADYLRQLLSPGVAA